MGEYSIGVMSGTIDGGAHSDFVDFHFEGNDEMEDGRPWLAEPPGRCREKSPSSHASPAATQCCRTHPVQPERTGAGVGETVFHP